MSCSDTLRKLSLEVLKLTIDNTSFFGYLLRCIQEVSNKNYNDLAGYGNGSKVAAKATSATSAVYSSTTNYAKASAGATTASKATSATSATYSSTANYAKAIPSTITTRLTNLETSFQDGCNTIMQAVTAKGQTPASNSPTDIAAAINAIPNISTIYGDIVAGVGGYKSTKITAVNAAHFCNQEYLLNRSDGQWDVLKAGTYRVAMYSQNSYVYFSVNGTQTNLKFGQQYIDFNLKVGDIVCFYRDISQAMYCCGYICYIG